MAEPTGINTQVVALNLKGGWYSFFILTRKLPIFYKITFGMVKHQCHRHHYHCSAAEQETTNEDCSGKSTHVMIILVLRYERLKFKNL